MSVRIRFDYARFKDSFKGALLSLETEVRAKVRDAMVTAGNDIIEEARQRHPYTDRTGDLTASMFFQPTGWNTGVFRATTHYASYVEYGTSRNAPYPYLGPVVATFKERVQAELNK